MLLQLGYQFCSQIERLILPFSVIRRWLQLKVIMRFTVPVEPIVPELGKISCQDAIPII